MGNETSMLCELLQRLNAEGLLTPQEAMLATGCGQSTYYRWSAGETEPTATAFSLLVRNARRPETRQALLAFMAAGTSTMIMDVPAELDVNGDDMVDFDDALDAAASAAAQIAEELKRVITMKRHGLGLDDATKFRSEAQRVISGMMVSVQIVEHLAQQENKNRRKARPLMQATSPLSIAREQATAQRRAPRAATGGVA